MLHQYHSGNQYHKKPVEKILHKKIISIGKYKNFLFVLYSHLLLPLKENSRNKPLLRPCLFVIYINKDKSCP